MLAFRAEHGDAAAGRGQGAAFSLDHDLRLSAALTEIRLSRSQHPNIVGAIDAGKRIHRTHQTLHFVMEYVPGLDRRLRADNGQLSAAACDLMQVSSALAERTKHGLVHRDIKPPTSFDTGRAGEAADSAWPAPAPGRQRRPEQEPRWGRRLHGAEQVQNATAVDIRADLYGVGGALHWC